MYARSLILDCLLLVLFLNGGHVQSAEMVDYFFTANEYLYHQMHDFGVSVTGLTSIKFEVRACHDAHVLLMQDKENFDSNIYEIVIGGWINSKSVIRKARQGINLESAYHALLHCNLLRPFWISWGDGIIKAGLNETIGQGEFISYIDPNPSAVRFLSVSTGFGATGHWVFERNK